MILPEIKRPDEVKAWLDRFVIGQDEAKKTLSVAVTNHYKRIRHNANPSCKTRIDKSNVLLLGPTGCGKTLLVRKIAEYLDVPCYIQDCTKIMLVPMWRIASQGSSVSARIIWTRHVWELSSLTKVTRLPRRRPVPPSPEMCPESAYSSPF